MPNRRHRPVFLDLTRIRMPVNAVVSILHRITGILLFLSIPGLIYLLSLSLRSEQDYARVQALFATLPMKLLGVVVVWVFVFFFFVGLCFLLFCFFFFFVVVVVLLCVVLGGRRFF